MPAWAWWAIGGYLLATIIVGALAWAACVVGAREDEEHERMVASLRRARENLERADLLLREQESAEQ